MLLSSIEITNSTSYNLLAIIPSKVFTRLRAVGIEIGSEFIAYNTSGYQLAIYANHSEYTVNLINVNSMETILSFHEDGRKLKIYTSNPVFNELRTNLNFLIDIELIIYTMIDEHIDTIKKEIEEQRKHRD